MCVWRSERRAVIGPLAGELLASCGLVSCVRSCLLSPPRRSERLPVVVAQLS